MPFAPKRRRYSTVKYDSMIMRPRKSMLYRSIAVANKIHVFKRVGTPIQIPGATAVGPALPVVGNGISVSATGPASLNNTVAFGFAFDFELAYLSGVSEITSLFDNYRIKAVWLQFAFSSNQAPAQGTNGQIFAMPIVNMAYDPDDNAAPASQSVVLENSYCKTYRLGDAIFSKKIQPRAQAVVTNNALISQGGILNPKTWLDCTAQNVKHFGLKGWVNNWPLNAVGTSSCVLTITPTYIIEAKNVV